MSTYLPEELRKIQQIETEALKDIISICDRLQIEYFLIEYFISCFGFTFEQRKHIPSINDLSLLRINLFIFLFFSCSLFEFELETYFNNLALFINL